MRSIPLCLAVLAFTAVTGAAAPQSAGANRKPAAAAAPRQQAKLTDPQLEAAIRAKFAKSKINADKFTVRVQGGVAHIDGKTEVLQHKGVATRMAKTAGALMVDNRIQVSDAAKEKAAGNLEQGRRRAQIKRGDSRSDARSPK
jgi:hypothetical protein